MVAALDTYSADDAMRRLVFRQVLAGDPDDTFVREAQAEVKVSDAWVLKETVTAKQRRVEIKALVAQSNEDSGKLFVSEPNEMELALGLTFTQKFETRTVRVAGDPECPVCGG